MKKLILLFVALVATVQLSSAQNKNYYPNGPYLGCYVGVFPPSNGQIFHHHCDLCYYNAGGDPSGMLYICGGAPIADCFTCFEATPISWDQVGLAFPNAELSDLNPSERYTLISVPDYTMADGSTGTLCILTSDAFTIESDEGTELECTVISYLVRSGD